MIGKSERLLCIYTDLLNGKVLRKAELAERFGVVERSIQRDFDEIRNYLSDSVSENSKKYELVYSHSRGGYLLEESDISKLNCTEVLAVCKILLDSRAFTKPEMMSIIDKLENCCGLEQNKSIVDELLKNEKYHYIELQHHTRYMDKLWDIGLAIKESKLVEITYQKVKNREVVKRILKPVGIMFSEFYFYLIAFIHDKEKIKNANISETPTMYRFDRIQELTVSNQHFKIPYSNRFEEGEFRKRVQFMYGGSLRKVKFKYTGPSVEAVLDRIPTAKVLSNDHDIYTIEAEVYGNGIDMWLRSQGDNVELL